MDSIGSTATPTGGLAGLVMHAVSPLFADATLLELTVPGVPDIWTGYWPQDAGPHRHRRVIATADLDSELSGETFDVALVRTTPGAAGDAATLRAAARALNPGGLLVLTLAAAAVQGVVSPESVVPEPAAATEALTAAGLRAVAEVVPADVLPAINLTSPSRVPERVVLARPGPAYEADSPSGTADGTETAPGTGVRDAGVRRLLRLEIALVVAAAEAAEDRTDAAVEITRLTTTLRARNISLTRRVERADRNAERWEKRYEQLRNRPALRLASAVTAAVRRAARRDGPNPSSPAAAPWARDPGAGVNKDAG